MVVPSLRMAVNLGFGKNSQKKITHKNVEDLITKGRTSLIKGFKGKSGNDFEAYLVLDSNLKTAFEFNNNKK